MALIQPAATTTRRIWQQHWRKAPGHAELVQGTHHREDRGNGQASFTRYRCDRCGAQAYVRVRLSTGGEFLFCGHHWGRHADALRPQATEVVDESDRLIEAAASPEA